MVFESEGWWSNPCKLWTLELYAFVFHGSRHLVSSLKSLVSTRVWWDATGVCINIPIIHGADKSVAKGWVFGITLDNFYSCPPLWKLNPFHHLQSGIDIDDFLVTSRGSIARKLSISIFHWSTVSWDDTSTVSGRIRVLAWRYYYGVRIVGEQHRLSWFRHIEKVPDAAFSLAFWTRWYYRCASTSPEVDFSIQAEFPKNFIVWGISVTTTKSLFKLLHLILWCLLRMVMTFSIENMLLLWYYLEVVAKWIFIRDVGSICLCEVCNFSERSKLGRKFCNQRD